MVATKGHAVWWALLRVDVQIYFSGDGDDRTSR